MKIGVVGLGFMGSTHLQAYQRIPNADIVAIASSSDRKLSGDLTGIEGNLSISGVRMDFSSAAKYRSADELIQDPRVEAVDLCVPTYLHRPLAELALSAGKHVLVEKPMALTAADCRAMLTRAHRAGRVLMVAQVLRFWPDYMSARECVASGAVGSAVVAHFFRRCAAPKWGNWLGDPDKSGGGVFDLLIHDFDFCVALFGKPQWVRASGVEATDHGVDYLHAELAFEGNVFVTVSGGWLSGDYPFVMGFTIAGQGGTLDYHSESRRLTMFRSDDGSTVLPLSEIDGFQAELQSFLESCARGAAPEQCPPDESALAVEIALAAIRSRREDGSPVQF